MSYTIADVRRFTRKSARNAQSSSMYSDQDIDDAYFEASFEWTRLVRPSRTLTALTLAVGSSSIPAFPSNWTPENTMQVDLTLAGSIITPGINFVTMDQLYIERAKRGIGSPLTLPQDRPRFMAVPDSTQATTLGQIDTLSDQAYGINLWQWNPFVPWTSGQGLLSGSVGTANQILPVTVLAGGYYPGATPTVTVSAGTGSGATFVVTMNGTTISSIAVSAAGTNYTGTPVFSLNGVVASGVSIGFSDEQVQIIASSGAPYYLQRFEPENAEMARDSMYASFIANAKRLSGMGAGGRGGQTVDKDNCDNYGRRRIREVVA